MSSKADDARAQRAAAGDGLQVWPVEGIGAVRTGDDLVALIGAALESRAESIGGIRAGDVLVVTSKIVSKAEGRSVPADQREQAIADETVRVVAERSHPGGVTRIVENRNGLVLAAAGVDASNTDGDVVLLLPIDPDRSALLLADGLRKHFGVPLGVIVSDTLGRPWRNGQTDVAIGAAGVIVIEDLAGSTDADGRELAVTAPAVGDELAAAADLVKGKATGVPVALVRGAGRLVGALDLPGANAIVRPSDDDLFRRGSAEAWAEGYAAGLAARGSASS